MIHFLGLDPWLAYHCSEVFNRVKVLDNWLLPYPRFCYGPLQKFAVACETKFIGGGGGGRGSLQGVNFKLAR